MACALRESDADEICNSAVKKPKQQSLPLHSHATIAWLASRSNAPSDDALPRRVGAHGAD
jgi:hypothetical protein